MVRAAASPTVRTNSELSPIQCQPFPRKCSCSVLLIWDWCHLPDLFKSFLLKRSLVRHLICLWAPEETNLQIRSSKMRTQKLWQYRPHWCLENSRLLPTTSKGTRLHLIRLKRSSNCKCQLTSNKHRISSLPKSLKLSRIRRKTSKEARRVQEERERRRPTRRKFTTTELWGPLER